MPHRDGRRLRLREESPERVEKLFYDSFKVMLTACSHQLILPPHATDARLTKVANVERGKEA